MLNARTLRIYIKCRCQYYECLQVNYTTTRVPSHTQNHETNGSIEFLQPYPIVAADALLVNGMAVISVDLSINKHFSEIFFCILKLCYQLVYCCLTWYILVRICIAKCFLNSSKQFHCKATFDSEHTLYLGMHHACNCTAYAKLV
jgi:hypothetical protein